MLAKSVVSDLDVLRSLYHEATQGKGVNSRAVRGRLLTDALVLVRGPLLADRPAGAVRAGSPTRSSMPNCRCSSPTSGSPSPQFHLEKERAEKAIEALNASLNSAPADERLWNELLRATHATGDAARLAGPGLRPRHPQRRTRTAAAHGGAARRAAADVAQRRRRGRMSSGLSTRSISGLSSAGAAG